MYATLPWLIFLGSVALIWGQSPRRAGFVSPAPKTPIDDDSENSGTQLKEKISVLDKAYRAERQRRIGLERILGDKNREDRQFKRRVPSMVTWSAILWAICTWFAFYPGQGFIQGAELNPNNRILRTLVDFSGTTLSASLFGVAAIWLGYRAQRFGKSSKLSIGFKVGFGAFLSGLVWALHTTPELYSIASPPENYLKIYEAYLRDWGLTLTGFLLLSKLVLLPFVGFVLSAISPSRIFVSPKHAQ